ncbi:MAG TPA: hypothetical protein VFJ85_08630 [Acidimicrobiales bacterium]|nr:hypothetical protein [Acidimicrobiales bacterium]
MRLRRPAAVTVLGLAAPALVLAAATSAWAWCSPYSGNPPSLTVSPDRALPGATVTVSGRDWAMKAGPTSIAVHWDAPTGPVLGEVPPFSSGTFSVPVVLPEGGPGAHALVVVSDPYLVSSVAITLLAADVPPTTTTTEGAASVTPPVAAAAPPAVTSPAQPAVVAPDGGPVVVIPPSPPVPGLPGASGPLAARATVRAASPATTAAPVVGPKVAADLPAADQPQAPTRAAPPVATVRLAATRPAGHGPSVPLVAVPAALGAAAGGGWLRRRRRRPL